MTLRAVPRTVRAAVVVLLSAAALAATVTTTQAAFHAGFTGEARADGSIDIAQSEDGTSQHPTAAEAKALPQANPGVPVRALAEIPHGWPTVPTAVVPVQIHNLSPQAVVTLRLKLDGGTAGTALFSRLAVGLQVDGRQAGDGTVLPGTWFQSHPDGALVTERLESGRSARLDLHVWMGPEATPADYAQALDLGVQVTGETVGGEIIALETDWT
ncbi:MULTISPECIES: hypothetical protein [Arthrobacter]|uniref:Alternate signal-mediated exported protein, RER_14450 family n=2 Tax=Arthrobacter TaxID=1663 RepID=A0ABU9KNX8_9MICC|nr:hypothetical protein [Arthrobacter sp. YJM1]MDP5228623.1 hypothetical protein [Arthrobacter sp. YJM1]